jgi:glycosyltransferase involved in cell wall biosynthesis
MIEAACAAGLPTVMTVHDFYLLCPAARLVDLGGLGCSGPDEGRRCATCLAATGNLTGRYRGRLRWLLRRWDVVVRRLHGPALEARFRRLRGLAGRLGAVACPSRFMAEALAREGLAPGARVIPNGSELSPLPPRTGAGRPPVLGMLARHSVSKGTHLLVEALRLAPRLDVRVEIHGGGDGRYLAAVERQARGDGRISFAGPFRPEDAARIHAGLDALVVPSVWPENHPLVMADALSAGRPCVAPEPGGAAELLGGGRYGLTFALGSPRSLAEALTKLIGQPGPLEELRRNIAADRPVPPRAEVARRYEELYRELR